MFGEVEAAWLSFWTAYLLLQMPLIRAHPEWFGFDKGMDAKAIDELMLYFQWIGQPME